MEDSDSETERDILELQSALLPSTHNSQKITCSGESDLNEEACKRALDLNRKYDEILKLVLYRLKLNHASCLRKLEQVRILIKSNPEKRLTLDNDCSYFKLGFPYFKDSHDFPCPSNPDVHLVKKFNIVTYPEKKTLKWNSLQKALLLKKVHVAVKKRKQQEISLNVKKIEREIAELQLIESSNTKQKNMKELKNSLSLYNSQLLNLANEPLECLVKPLKEEEEFDWEVISLEGAKTLGHSANECRTMWRMFLHPDISKKGWTIEEQTQLKRIAHQHRLQNWDKIAQDLGTQRTSYQCFLFFRLRLDTSNDKSWTPREDNYLKSLVHSCKIGNFIPWSKVAYYMENRSKSQCYTRWMYSISRNLKGRFLPEEDNVILAGVREFGLKFHQICQYLPQRKYNTVKRRYEMLSLSLKENTLHVWSTQNDKTLWSVVTKAKQTQGKISFPSLCKYFPGKTPLSLKKRYQLLEQWLQKSSSNNIINAPRRCLKGYRANINFKSAVEQLQSKLASSPPKTSSLQVTNYKIQKRLVAYFEEQTEKNIASSMEKTPTTQMDYLNLRNILILLDAKLDKNLLDFYSEKGFMLQDIVYNLSKVEEDLPSQSITQRKAIKTYSRKRKPISLPSPSDTPSSTNNNSYSIWADENSTGNPDYVLPPTFNTLLAFKNIMLKKFKEADHLDEKYSEEFVAHFNKWNRRFDILFTWAANLSNIPSCLYNTIFDDASEVSTSNSTPKLVPSRDTPSTSHDSTNKKKKQMPKPKRLKRDTAQ